MGKMVLDVNVVNAFIAGVENVLKTMCQTEPTSSKPELKKDSKVYGDVSGTISLTGQTKGIVILSLSKAAVCTIVSRMIYEEKSEIDNDVIDAVGELTNMIAGDSRKNLAEKGMVYEAGIPTVVAGANHKVTTMISESSSTIVIPFKTDKGEAFVVEFTFE